MIRAPSKRPYLLRAATVSAVGVLVVEVLDSLKGCLRAPPPASLTSKTSHALATKGRFERALIVFLLLLAINAVGAEDWKNKPDQYWKEHLTKEQYDQCRMKGSERPYTGRYYKLPTNLKGHYRCSVCGQDLFDADKQVYDMGYANFTEPKTANAVELKPDPKFLIKRTEVVCSRCGSHLGHVFDDGPGPAGKRYQIKSACIEFFDH